MLYVPDWFAKVTLWAGLAIGFAMGYWVGKRG